MTIDQYEERKCQTLLNYGCPKNELWLTECMRTQEAYYFYGDIVEELNPYEKPYCVYYHESGDLLAFATFEDEEEFQAACRYLADYLS